MIPCTCAHDVTADSAQSTLHGSDGNTSCIRKTFQCYVTRQLGLSVENMTKRCSTLGGGPLAQEHVLGVPVLNGLRSGADERIASIKTIAT